MVKICENTIEMVKMTLYSNNNKQSYQEIEMVNIDNGKALKRKIVAPVDFFTIASAIMYEIYLCEFINSTGMTWCSEVLESMIEVLVEGE